jgi:chromosomal replication initiator protein
LLLDDVQFIAGKERTEEEFFHTFNAIHESGGQVVLTSDRAPKALSGLEARLRSRFEWGLIADVQSPDLETRIAILRSKIGSKSPSVPPEVLEFIAAKVQSNIRELEGSLNRVVQQAAVLHQRLTVDLAAAALQEVLVETAPPVGPESILQAICRYFGVSLEDLRGKARDRRVIVPRQVAMYLLREDGKLSLPEIGNLLGGRDHTTVLHGNRAVVSSLQNDSRLRGDLKGVRDLLRVGR